MLKYDMVPHWFIPCDLHRLAQRLQNVLRGFSRASLRGPHLLSPHWDDEDIQFVLAVVRCSTWFASKMLLVDRSPVPLQLACQDIRFGSCIIENNDPRSSILIFCSSDKRFFFLTILQLSLAASQISSESARPCLWCSCSKFSPHLAHLTLYTQISERSHTSKEYLLQFRTTLYPHRWQETTWVEDV